LGIYLALKIGDMLVRGTYSYLLDGTIESNAFLVEMLFGGIAPWAMLLFSPVRASRKGLFTAAALIVGGVLLNRINVFVVGYKPPVSQSSYFPAFSEILVTTGLVAALMFLYRLAITYLPVISAKKQEAIS
jgi:Ni/Fe-hydrogenase subunit HybB-like protein